MWSVLGCIFAGIFLVLTAAFAVKGIKALAKEGEEAQEAAEKAAKEAAEGREKDRRSNFRKELYSDLEQIITTPDVLVDHRYGSAWRETGYRWKHLAEFILRVNRLRDQSETIVMLERRIEKQSALLRDMQLHQRDIMKTLQMGSPVE